MRLIVRACVTLVLGGVTVLAGRWGWDYYQHSPWTKDGRIRADIVVIAPDVAGAVTELEVRDNQRVKKGELLFRIDSLRYRVALDEAKAKMDHARHAWQLAISQERRRIPLAKIRAISEEDLDNVHSEVLLAKSEFELNQAQWHAAKVDLARTQVFAPSDGVITNVRLQEGNYVTQGGAALSLIKSGSFYVTAYFEETKLKHVREGAAARISLMGDEMKLTGTVESIASGVANSNTQADTMLLPQVQQAFNWVRLAQRIPVNIRLIDVPQGVRLSAGMNVSVKLDEPKSKAAIR